MKINKLDMFSGIVIGFLIGTAFVYGVMFEKHLAIIIDKRASVLGFMRYDGKANKQVYRDDKMTCDKWTFKYLKEGTMAD